ncbi:MULTISPECIES: MFS transporter [Arthrospira]|uniref:Major facilitator superfamily transporter n=2 Tax=Limnospira platensis TaxID=118562 RepID=A0A5M3T9T2_LIMPL|nr:MULTISPECIES: MFS transporter [Arthrospira]MBD2670854.1 MFS transporter [Arthrospira platensis FACHB-439]MBD2711565.1 MFS transporter [Arthrospira platensis FACHB-835]MDF2210071.1 MFS transporter [Arthrospira platensis NCB002]MDT9184044.1 MFS transporter [Limnospira sp. PMC 289.06]MDT9296262.1 MFS transporter [Arthrospira platensis PCC 7345]MDT9311807.1 MFS transporter [Limnospira sp. Paracas R14]QQW30267.1 MFS transporter [Arthrospira sp. PCC 9108]BAI89090.1 major facilitator superfamil
MIKTRQRRSLLMLFIAGLCFWSAITTLLPTLPLYIAYLGGTKQQIGLVMGAFALGLLPSRIVLGPLADKRGRKLVLLIGTIVATVAPLGYLFTDSMALMALLRAFHGISIAAFTIGYTALVTDLAPENRRGEIVGYMSLVAPIGMAIGPALGGFIQAGMGYGPLFISGTVFGLLSLLAISQVLEASRNPELSDQSEAKGSPIANYLKRLGSPALKIPALVLLMVGLIFGTLVTFIPLYIQDAGLSLNPGLFYTMKAIASFAVRLPMGRASDRYGRGIFITTGLICYLVSMAILTIANNNFDVLLAGLFEGAAAGITIPMMLTLIADRCLPQERGQFFSICLGGFDLGLALAGPIFGSIADAVGYRNLFTINTGLATLALLLFITQSSRNPRESFRFALGRGKDSYAIN